MSTGPATVPIPDQPGGLLISRDLMFVSKVTGTARALGFTVATAGNVALVEAYLERWQPIAVFVDLTAADLASPERLARFRELAAPGTPFVAFGPHVDVAGLDAARKAGCEDVMPRSKFSAQLPEILRERLAHPA